LTLGTSTTNAIFDLFGSSQTLAGLTAVSNGGSTAGQKVTNNAVSASSVLTINNDASNTNADVTFAGVIADGPNSGTVSLSKTGSKTLTLSGANAFTGSTSITAGTLTVASTSSIGTGALVVSNPNTSAATDVALNLNNAAQSVGGLSGSIATPSGGGNTVTINLGTSHVLTINQNSDATFAGVIAGATGSVKKSGSAKLTLGGANSFGGDTTIIAGTLALASGASLSSANIIVGDTAAHSSATLDLTALGAALTLSSTQTLKGHGTVIGNTTIAGGATVSPGNSIGDLTETGDQTWGAGGNYFWELGANANGTAGVDWDHIHMTGVLTITSDNSNPTASQFTINISGAPPTPQDKPYKWEIAKADGGITGFDALAFNLVSNDGQENVSRYYWLSSDSNAIYINFVPEPGSMTVMLGAAGVGLRRRRRARVK
jgi:autotransporter-associated beta strand protein